jgi:hypothetical protein
VTIKNTDQKVDHERYGAEYDRLFRNPNPDYIRPARLITAETERDHCVHGVRLSGFCRKCMTWSVEQNKDNK